MSELPPTYESITIASTGAGLPNGTFEKLTKQEYNLIQRIRQSKRDGVLKVRVEACRPVKVRFIIDSRAEVL